MKKLVWVFVAFLSVLAFAGCDDESLPGLSAALQKEFGVPVNLIAPPNSECLRQQLLSIKSDYESLTAASKKVVAARIQRYNHIALNPTVLTQTISGDVTFLAYVRDSGQGYWYTVTSKAIGDHRQYSGTEPVTKVDNKSPVLSLTAESLRDESLQKTYYTNSVDVYDRAESVDGRPFIEARQNGDIWLKSEDASAQVRCGTLVSLAAIVGEGLERAPRTGH